MKTDEQVTLAGIPNPLFPDDLLDEIRKELSEL